MTISATSFSPLSLLIRQDMQEVKAELKEERNKRIALQVSEVCLEFCMHSYLVPAAYCHMKEYGGMHILVVVADIMTLVKLMLNIFHIQEEVNALRTKH